MSVACLVVASVVALFVALVVSLVVSLVVALVVFLEFRLGCLFNVSFPKYFLWLVISRER